MLSLLCMTHAVQLITVIIVQMSHPTEATLIDHMYMDNLEWDYSNGIVIYNTDLADQEYFQLYNSPQTEKKIHNDTIV